MGRLLGTLVVVVLKAKNLPNKQRIGKQDAYATVLYRGQRNKTQVVRKAGQHPVFDDEFRYEIREDVSEEVHAEVTASGGVKPAQEGQKAPKGRVLKIAVYSDDPRDPQLIGDATVDFTDTMTKGEFDEWIPLNDIQKKYAGEIFLEMTYYDQTRKALRPAQSTQDVASEFGRLPTPGKHSSLGPEHARHLSLGSSGTQLRASTSYNRLSSAGIEPYAPNYAMGLIPPARDSSPAQAGPSTLNSPQRHNSLNDADISALSTSMSGMSIRKPLPLPGSGARPSLGGPPLSLHTHRASLPSLDHVASPRAASYAPGLASQPEVPSQAGFGQSAPSTPPAGIEGWRRRVHSETQPSESAPIAAPHGYPTPPSSRPLPGQMPSPAPSQANYGSPMPMATSQNQAWLQAGQANGQQLSHSPSPRPFPPLAAPSYPPGMPLDAQAASPVQPGYRPLTSRQSYDDSMYASVPHGQPMQHQFSAPPAMPNAYSSQPQHSAKYAERPQQEHYSAVPAPPSRVPAGYVPGPPPPGFRPASQQSLPRPPSQNFSPVPTAVSQPAQRPFETMAYPPPNGQLPHSESLLPYAQSPPSMRSSMSMPVMQSSPQPQYGQQGDSLRREPLYQPGATISGMASPPKAPPRPPEMMRPQTGSNTARPSSPSMLMPQQGYHEPPRSPQPGQQRYASAHYPPQPAHHAVEPRHASYGGPGGPGSVPQHAVSSAPGGVLRPLPMRPEQQPSYAPPAAPQQLYYHPPSR